MADPLQALASGTLVRHIVRNVRGKRLPPTGRRDLSKLARMASSK